LFTSKGDPREILRISLGLLSLLFPQEAPIKAQSINFFWPAFPHRQECVKTSFSKIDFDLVFWYRDTPLKEGGRMVIPVGTSFQKLKKIVKRGGKIEITDVLPVRFVPLTGEALRQKPDSEA